MFTRLTILTLGFVTLCGCNLGGLIIDDKQDFDETVEEVWLDLNQDRKVPAVEYFEKGGKHYNIEERPNAVANVDRDLVLPLVKRIRDEFKAEVSALLPEDEDRCWEILVKLPTSAASQSGIERAIAETDAKFAGKIGIERGYKWLGFDFHDPDDE